MGLGFWGRCGLGSVKPENHVIHEHSSRRSISRVAWRKLDAQPFGVRSRAGSWLPCAGAAWEIVLWVAGKYGYQDRPLYPVNQADGVHALRSPGFP